MAEKLQLILLEIFQTVGIYFFTILNSLAASLTAITSLIVAVVAVIALNKWKKQSLTDKKLKLLEDLYKATFEFKSTMEFPLYTLQLIMRDWEKYIIKNKADCSQNRDSVECFMGYSKEHGEEYSELMESSLEGFHLVYHKLSAMVYLGMAYEFPDYDKCSKIITSMLGISQTLKSFHIVLKNAYKDDSEETKNIIRNFISLNAIEYAELIDEQQLELLKYLNKRFKAELNF
jgi:hypothetical protein